MNGTNISPQLIAALLAGRPAPGMAPPQAPLLAQPMGRDPVAAMRGMMGSGGAGGIGGGGGGMLGGLDPMKLAQLQDLLNRQGGGLPPTNIADAPILPGGGYGAGLTQVG